MPSYKRKASAPSSAHPKKKGKSSASHKYKKTKLAEEQKFVDYKSGAGYNQTSTQPSIVNIDATNPVATPSYYIKCINSCAEGVSRYDRIGKRVTLKSVQLKGLVENMTGAAYNNIRCLLIWDKQPTGALPNLTDILNNAATMSLLNDDNSERFLVLKEEYFDMTGNNTSGNMTIECNKVLKWYVTPKNKETIFNAATQSDQAAGIAKGALYLVIASTGGTGSGIQASFHARVRFEDP